MNCEGECKMPQVYTGKILIPGDKIEEFLKIIEDFEKRRVPFREYLNRLNDDFVEYLSIKFEDRTVDKHAGIISMFIEFICNYTDVKAIEEITAGMVKTHFHQWYKRKVWDRYEYNRLRVALKKFFKFLENEKGISNLKVRKALFN
jgi:hypothetical protein